MREISRQFCAESSFLSPCASKDPLDLSKMRRAKEKHHGREAADCSEGFLRDLMQVRLDIGGRDWGLGTAQARLKEDHN